MPRYLQLSEPLGPEFTTIRQWAQAINQSPEYILAFWRKLDGWPEPVGELPPAGGTGRGRHVYRTADLDQFLAAHEAAKHEPRPDPIATTLDPDLRVTLGYFAGVAGVARKTVTQARGYTGFPEPGSDGRYRLGDLIDFWPTRPGKRGPGRQRREQDA